VQWKKTVIKESSGSWMVEIDIHMATTPDFAHIPMRFSFTPITYFELALTDDHPKEPLLRRVPLQNRSPIVESVDVGFLDPSSGTIQKRTRFSFRITRDLGFEAGEYTVKVQNGRSNQQIGTQTKITLEGKNEVIDRRAMVFDDKKKEKKKDEKPADSEPAKSELSPDDDAYWAGGPEEEAEDDSLPPPASMREKPGGCGCSVPGSSSAPPGVWLGLSLLGLFVSRRRR
jgi:MYXO-CTERM domain-containing protein